MGKKNQLSASLGRPWSILKHYPPPVSCSDSLLLFNFLFYFFPFHFLSQELEFHFSSPPVQPLLCGELVSDLVSES